MLSRTTASFTVFPIASPLFAKEAEIIFANAAVLTADETNPTVEAVAKTGEEIIYVGDVEGAEAFRRRDLGLLLGSTDLKAARNPLRTSAIETNSAEYPQ